MWSACSVLRHRPELGVGQLRRRHDAEHLAHEVVVGDQLVDAPQQQAVRVGLAAAAGERTAERRRAEMRMNVDQRLAADDVADQLLELGRPG